MSPEVAGLFGCLIGILLSGLAYAVSHRDEPSEFELEEELFNRKILERIALALESIAKDVHYIGED